ncbi:hypothetical protein TraAM80_00569 [Trypanosoma rangeli]|uniref:Uncharacterized protein n=1 Tax=Trypanosoma rangeli TaxID=5698 RepID=A0A422P2S6_TRYRA|nr:uncharacterized protein TraAM80_00569 [Trypanosoma rangeli]RNF12009.1 hypothetical protein TraAM80_00569 [Trypanosoma rangeli]|eukprot:RNF12009.1 hypothetical protein TraAM80_00569 [Trypanosoma rangeli]
MTLAGQPQESPQQSAETANNNAVDVNTALPDLEGPFKEVLTRSLEEVLQKRPADPISFLADHLLEKSDGHELEQHECLVANNIHCILRKACTRKNGAGVYQVPGLPLLQLNTPTAFELDAALRHLDTLTPPNAEVVVFIELPSPPTDLFFLKGVPYLTNITEQLLQRRRGATDAGLLSDDEEKEEECVGSAKKVKSLLCDALNVGITTLQEEVAAVATPASRFRVVELPVVQSNFLDVFEIIDGALGMRKHYWDVRRTAHAEVPSAVFASFNPRMSNMTFSRIIAAILPLHEQLQRRRIASTLDINKTRIRQLNFSYVTQYWREVQQRRRKRDQERAQLNASLTRSETPKQQRSPRMMNSSVKKLKKAPNDVLTARVRRRENEDAIFLCVSQQLRSQAAIRIQALYRGYRLRKNVPTLLPPCEPVTDTACWVEDIPASVPALLRRTVEHLSRTHGELFGNYCVSCPPSPRCVTVLKPSRKVLKKEVDNDVDSETESWEEESVILPLKRQTRPPPHFNVLRRLMECEFLSRCNTIDYALSIQLDCSGLSVLQRHAYDCYKSSVLNLMHIAFLELYHRDMLPATVLGFSEYMQRLHRPVFGWLSAPHLFSRMTLHRSEDNALVPTVFCEREVMETERVLLIRAYGVGALFSPSCSLRLEQQESSTREEQCLDDLSPQLLPTTTAAGSRDVWVCKEVHAAPAFLSELFWEAALQNASHSLRESKVAWWSLQPDPAVYINGEPLVSVPRHELQEVPGRPRFDEHVVRIEETKQGLKAVMQVSPSRAVRGTPRADPWHSSYGSVGDGSSTTTLEGKGVDEPAASMRPPTVDEASYISTFGGSLLWEDVHLAQLLNQDISLYPAECLQAYSTVNVSEGQYGVPIVHASQQPLVVVPISEWRWRASGSLHDSSYLAGTSGSGDRSFRQSRLQLRESWCKVMDASKKCLPLVDRYQMSWEASNIALSQRNSFMSPGSTLRHDREPHTNSILVSEAETVDAVARRVAEHVLNEGNFVHERPWITPVCGRAWVTVFEQFVFKCLSQLREGYTIVLAVGDPSQLMLFNALCLLKHSMQSQKVAPEEPVDTACFGLFPKKRPFLEATSLLSDETISRLSFMHGFYKCVGELVKHSDVSVAEIEYVVLKVMQENSPGGLAFVNEISTLMKSAEQETNSRILVDTILAIVQRVELYCWLLLFQAFLTSPAAASVFDEHDTVVFPSFTAFVDDTALIAWMERIDPWISTPGKSPDPFHLRYSNGLRRWDDRNYIFSGAL